MKPEKISVEEINSLREHAQKEKEIHRKIMERIKQISSVRLGNQYLPEGLPQEEQMQIVRRERPREIMALLQAYAGLRMSSHDSVVFERANLCEEAQMYIYRLSIGFDAVRCYMLENNRLCLAVEKALITEHFGNSVRTRKFSREAEIYFVQYVLQQAQRQDSASVLINLRKYIEQHELHEDAQVALMAYLSCDTGRDSLLDGCRDIVKYYLDRYKKIGLEAQRKLVTSGDYDLIMDYIRFSHYGLQVEEELCERGNRKEIEAYFRRYATLL